MSNQPSIERHSSIVPIWVPVLIGNLIPLYGALFLQWDIFSIFFIYWMENIVIGIYTALKMAGTGASIFIKGNIFNKIGATFGTTFFIGFFTVHYGMFCMGHLSFLKDFFYSGTYEGSVFGVMDMINFTQHVAIGGMFWGIIAIIISEGIKAIQSLNEERDLSPDVVTAIKLKNPDLNSEFIRKAPSMQSIMFQPYGRIIILHITIIFGGMLVQTLGDPLWGLGLLIALKITYDFGIIDPIKRIKNAKKND